MFFAALVSAYLVIKAGTLGNWVPPENVRLPIEATAFNTFILFLSGCFLFFAGRYKAMDAAEKLVKNALMKTILLGSFFVLFQGYEWINLISLGMTMKSGIFGATFYLLIGSHGIHALSAIFAMFYLLFKFKKQELTLQHIYAMQVFWFFVVGVWPILYGLVYF